MTTEQKLREALEFAADFIEDVHDGEWVGGDDRRYSVQASIRAALAQPPAPEQQAPQGWKLVPVEPTEEMMQAGRASGAGAGWLAAWHEMLDASPAAPEAAKPAPPHDDPACMACGGAATHYAGEGETELAGTYCDGCGPRAKAAKPETERAELIERLRWFVDNTNNPAEEYIAKAAALLSADSKAGGEPVAYGNRDELDNMLHDRSATVVGRRDGQHQVPLFGQPPAPDGNARPVAWLDREQLAELQHCNGMSVWAESPGIYHPDPSALGVKAPSTLVAVYTRPQQQAKPLTDDEIRIEYMHQLQTMNEKDGTVIRPPGFTEGVRFAERARDIGKDQA